MNSTNINAEPMRPLLRLGVVFWMLIWETVTWNMLTRALTPSSRATAAMVTLAFQVTGGYGHAEVDPPAAGNDAIDNCRFEEVSDDHLGPVHQLLRGFAVCPED